MYSRIISCTVNPTKAKLFRTTLNDQVLPRIQAQPGFAGNIESFDPDSGQFTCLTLWKTKTDVENYDKGLFKEVTAGLTPLLKGDPNVVTLPVENSSMHNIKAGAATA